MSVLYNAYLTTNTIGPCHVQKGQLDSKWARHRDYMMNIATQLLGYIYMQSKCVATRQFLRQEFQIFATKRNPQPLCAHCVLPALNHLMIVELF